MIKKRLIGNGPLYTTTFVHPPIEVDCSNWGNFPPDMPRTKGHFVIKNKVHPPIEVDCSEWGKQPGPSLELKLQVDPQTDSVTLAFGLVDLLDAINDLDRQLGGTGFMKAGAEQRNGTVTLMLAAKERTKAAERMAEICERLNKALEGHVGLQHAEALKNVQARVA